MRRALIYTLETDSFLRSLLQKLGVLDSSLKNKVLEKMKNIYEDKKESLNDFLDSIVDLKAFSAINDPNEIANLIMDKILSKFGDTPYSIKNKFLSKYSISKFPSIKAIDDSISVLILEAIVEKMASALAETNDNENSKKIQNIEDLSNKIKNHFDAYFTTRLKNNLKIEDAYYLFISAPIINDISFSVSSSFGEPSGMFGTAGGIVENYSKIMTALSGDYPVLSNILRAPIWESTNPLSLDLELLFHLKDDPIKDVALPSLVLASLASIRILGKKGEKVGVFKVPGINASNFNVINDAFKGQDTLSNVNKEVENFKNLEKSLLKQSRINGFVNIMIPGIVYNNFFLIEEANVSFSRGTTIHEWPVFAKVQLKCRTAFGARSFDVLDSLLSLYRLKFIGQKFEEETNLGGQNK